MMSDDAKAILLLCGRFEPRSNVEPLTQGEYTQLAGWLKSRSLRPSHLLDDDHQLEDAAADTGLDAPRLAGLTRRSMQLGLAVEEWNRSGIWVLCRSDPDYPARYKQHLREKAPPVLFGSGDRTLLCGGGLAIVGSRNIDERAGDFARQAAEWCAFHNMPVVSGGARGVDQMAMFAALEAGGMVLGVLASDLRRATLSPEARDAIAAGRLLLISPFHPEARFAVGNAMGRNKLIYAMADYALVVSSEENKGGTWTGAVEELKRSPRRPVFVRIEESAPPANRKLLKLGALPWPAFSSRHDPAQLLRDAATGQSDATEDEPSLFSAAIKSAPTGQNGSEPADAPPPPPENPQAKTATPPQSRRAEGEDIDPADRLYHAALPVILDTLDPQGEAPDEPARRLDVSKSQLVKWLKRAVDEGEVQRLSKPARYRRRKSK